MNRCHALLLTLGALLINALGHAASLPGHARIVYEARLSGLAVGQASQNWSLSKTHFQLDTEITPIFGPKIRYQSSGEVGDSGIKPQRYAEYRGGDNTPRQQANFDWMAAIVSFGNSENTQTAKLEMGAQDLNTLPFQLSWLNTKPGTNLQIVTGRKVRQDRFTAGDTVSFKLMGKLTNVRVWQTADRDDGMEVWLAPDFANLPVKIIRHDDRGEIQLVARTIEFQQE